ncbi:MAG: YqgE/AlgH family protein [Planctomycetaceae bacterium]|jgi:putative transcriptional regulator|nr:YqgE/AlgH family protein [Planctomycetaceae bacterium]
MNYSGKLLIASPSLIDPNFRQTVVFLVQGSDDGDDDDEVFGLVLNRVSDQPIRSIWKSVFQQDDCVTDSLLYLGGPVFRTLTALHSIKQLNSFEVIPGVYFTSTPNDLKQLVHDKSNNCFRFFVGSAGWSVDQLLQELADGVWYLAEATRELVFNDDTELWRHLIEAIGQDILSEILHTNKFPEDPALN